MSRAAPGLPTRFARERIASRPRRFVQEGNGCGGCGFHHAQLDARAAARDKIRIPFFLPRNWIDHNHRCATSENFAHCQSACLGDDQIACRNQIVDVIDKAEFEQAQRRAILQILNLFDQVFVSSGDNHEGSLQIGLEQFLRNVPHAIGLESTAQNCDEVSACQAHALAGGLTFFARRQFGFDRNTRHVN